MKNKVFLLLILFVGGASAYGQSDSAFQALEQRIVILEDEKDLRNRELNLQTDRLRTDFDSLKAASDSQGLTIWVAILVGLGFLGISVLGILKSSKNYAQKHVQDKLDKELPPMVQQRMEESFEKLLRQHSQTVMDLVGKHNRIEGFKRDKRILILCEDQTDCDKMMGLVGGMGFKKVQARIATTFENTEDFDLVIIAREDADLSRYQLLDGTKIWEYLASLSNDRVVLYYGPRFERLDAEVREKIHFSNIVFTIYARILEVFEYQYILEHQKNAPNPE